MDPIDSRLAETWPFGIEELLDYLAAQQAAEEFGVIPNPEDVDSETEQPFVNGDQVTESELRCSRDFRTVIQPQLIREGKENEF